MKKWLVSAIFALVLCVCFAPAQAAVVTGGTEYLWHIEAGEIVQNEDYEPVSYTGDSLWISQDGGESYAELPGLREESQRTWGRMDAALTPLDNGGLRVEARDGYSTEFTWTRDYSAAELAKALARAKPNPVTVMAANEGVAVGCLLVYDQQNGDPSQPGQFGWGAARSGSKEGYRMVWSPDGITWTWASEQPEDFTPYRSVAWWDGTAFYLSEGYASSDGDHWTRIEKTPIRTSLAIAADLGRYHFELVLPNGTGDWYNEVYLMEGDNRNEGVLLPHMGEAIKAQGIGVNSMIAAPGPNETVTLTVSGTGGSFSLDYPISSLDWCLENLSTPFRESTDMVNVTDGTISLSKVAVHYRNNSSYEMEGELIRTDGSGWQKVENTPFSPVFEILPYNGKTFMVLDNTPGEKRLYASTDGLKWVEVDALRPQELDESDTWGYADYTFHWTGERYYAALKAGVHRHGMMGHAGGGWYGKNTEVWFLNEAFEIIGSYDFGRLVEKVGYLNGTYYAQVSNSERTSDSGFDWGGEGSTLYCSADGKIWTAMGEEYLDIENIMVRQQGGEKRGNLPTGDPAKPLRSVARLDRWRFILWDRYQGNIDVYLLRDNANDMTCLDVEDELKSRWITPGFLTAAYTQDGKVEVTVTDLSTPSMKYSVVYTPEELDSWKSGDYHLSYRGNGIVDERRGNGTDVSLFELVNGEKELCYRDGTTNGKYMYLDSVSWSNSIELLPYSGKDFMVLDKVDGKVYLSADGKTWREATGDWIVSNRAHGFWQYAFLWTGDHYVGTCMLADDIIGDGYKVVGRREWSKESYQVILLDENLNLLHTVDFDSITTDIGCRDGVCYVREMGGPLFRSADGGRTWESTDIDQVWACLQGQDA